MQPFECAPFPVPKCLFFACIPEDVSFLVAFLNVVSLQSLRDLREKQNLLLELGDLASHLEDLATVHTEFPNTRLDLAVDLL